MSLKWFAMGLGLGATIAVLYTPKAGDETREILREKIDDARQQFTGRTQEQAWSITDVINECEGAVTRKADANGAGDAATGEAS